MTSNVSPPNSALGDRALDSYPMHRRLPAGLGQPGLQAESAGLRVQRRNFAPGK